MEAMIKLGYHRYFGRGPYGIIVVVAVVVVVDVDVIVIAIVSGSFFNYHPAFFNYHKQNFSGVVSQAVTGYPTASRILFMKVYIIYI